MRKGECLISADVQADRGARNQPTEEEIDVVQDQETTGAASEDRPDEQGENVVQDQEITGAVSEDRPDEQGEDVVQQPEGDDEDHAEGEEARQEKMTQIRDQGSGTN
ncbi:MAG TPA: hypothetical protein VK390_13500 [Propionibacteriaceae bacterium]|nr:hypothetical protein [Propionibacteriaceae bacterium]